MMTMNDAHYDCSFGGQPGHGRRARISHLHLLLVLGSAIALCSCKKAEPSCSDSIGSAVKRALETKHDEVPASKPWRTDSERLLAALEKTAIAACTTDKWSEGALHCFVESKTAAALESCGPQFTDAQKVGLRNAGMPKALDFAHPLPALRGPPYSEATRDYLDQVQRELSITADEFVQSGLRSHPRTTEVDEALGRARRRAIDDQPESPEETLSRVVDDARWLALRYRAELMFPGAILMREP